MLTYNTQRPSLHLPEYGRNIQAMVEHCLTLATREERTRCAHSIVKAMATLNNADLQADEESRRKLWDHLAVIADFRLDIDWPEEVSGTATPATPPLRVPYPVKNPQTVRRYGSALHRTIARLASMPPGDERDMLIDLVANHMKKVLLMEQRDANVDARVMRDLTELTHGEIRLTPETYRLQQFDIVVPVTSKKKKKK